MIDNALKTQLFKLKGRLYTLTVLQFLDKDLEDFSTQLNEITQQAPNLFQHTPIVLDLSQVITHQLDFEKICKGLRGKQLIPVGIQGGNDKLKELAIEHGLAVLSASSTHDKMLVQESFLPAKCVRLPVRSGQQVYAKGTDLIITGSVSQGAELLADGNIHVYGTLRGRALAGVSGNKEACIFCHALEAELLYIAGEYLLHEALLDYRKKPGPKEIRLINGKINIQVL